MLKLYFPHDQNARNDPALISLRRVYGWQGYGIYFAIIEILHEQDGYIQEESLDDIGYSLNIEPELFNNVITMLLQNNKLVITDGKISSKRVLENLKIANEKKEKRSKAGKKGMQARWSSNKQKLHDMKKEKGLV